LLILPARTPGIRVAQQLDHYEGLTSIDPHGTHLDDAVIKLKALAEFTQKFGDEFHRIEAVAKVGSTMKVLDMTRHIVREAVLYEEKEAVEFYESDFATEYSI
ncbi:hypothetical protein, partial [Mycolicibacter engbaekii]|uniref:hypothetical protein n=1 Tax=Mycolicibacter engbaekii TaxID=188915 RepID=UPI0013FDA253